jgi:DNA primase catalytic core
MIPDSTINEIRRRAADDIVDIIESYVKLKRSGKYYKGMCPFHDENTASFHVTPEMGIYKCFGCGEGGDAIDFLIKREGFDFMETIRWLAHRYMIDITGSNGRKCQKQGRSFTDQQESIVQGINSKKHQIRKRDGVVVLLDDLPNIEESQIPWLRFKNGISQGQFKIIQKYTERIWLYAEDYSRENALESLRNGVKARMQLRLIVKVEDGEVHSKDWLQYLMRNYEQTDELLRAIKHIIIQFRSKLTYRIYQQEFLNLLED